MQHDKITSVLTEHRLFPPHADFTAQANVNHESLAALYANAEDDHEGFWGDLAREKLDWKTPFKTILDDSAAPHYKWFSDGTINVSHNCLDRHLAEYGNKAAIIFEGEPGDTVTLTYSDLHKQVCLFANAMKSRGINAGDRVVIYMPMEPEALIAMQACARIGAIHSVVFGGFSAASLRDRIEGAGAVAVITADGSNRGGNIVELKQTVDDAMSEGCESIHSVFVHQRTARDVGFVAGRDIWWHDAIADQPSDCEPEWLSADHPLFLLYTSGSTGKPKGIQHSSAGYLLGAHCTNEWVMDLKPDDVFWCTADVGWITGHSYVVYGPLSVGATIVMYEGAPVVPDAGRFWRMVEDHKVSIFYTAPTAIRALMKMGDQWPNTYDLSSIRLLGTVGEPINPEAWIWYHEVIGKAKTPIVDTWWQTETGAQMIAPIPGVTATKPGSCTRPLPGIAVDIVDEAGAPVTSPEEGGYLVITKPWPAMLQTVYGDDKRYYDAYWSTFNGRYYVAGDSAHRDQDGYVWIMGRIDDVLNVSGHRLGTMEIESALVSHPEVIEAAVVGKPHEIKGESVFAYVVCKGNRPNSDSPVVKELRDWVAKEIGAIAKPDEIRFADNLPKTRSGKIMRRLLRSIAKDEEITADISTLENPAIIEQLQGK